MQKGTLQVMKNSLKNIIKNNLPKNLDTSERIIKIIAPLKLKKSIEFASLLQPLYFYNPILCKQELEKLLMSTPQYYHVIKESIRILEEYKDYFELFQRLETYAIINYEKNRDRDIYDLFEENISYYERLFKKIHCLYILTAVRIVDFNRNFLDKQDLIENTRLLLVNVLKKLNCYYLLDMLQNSMLKVEYFYEYHWIEIKLKSMNQFPNCYKLNTLNFIKKTFQKFDFIKIGNRSIVSMYEKYGSLSCLQSELLERIPTIDIAIVIEDEHLDRCTPLDFFMKFYIDNHCSEYLYITEYGHTDHGNVDYLIVADTYHYLYRIFLRKTSDYHLYLLGDATGLLNAKQETDKRIVVFKRDGEARKLPKDSTVLDFAFSLDTSGYIGLHFSGAMINNERTTQMDTVLNSGDKVEIITSSQCMATLDWFNILKTQLAKQQLIKYLKEQSRNKIRTMIDKGLSREMILSFGFSSIEYEEAEIKF